MEGMGRGVDVGEGEMDEGEMVEGILKSMQRKKREWWNGRRGGL